jgi:purine nucleosidase
MTLAPPIYLDCDTGIDDALALGYLLATPSLRLVGVGTVSGNVDAVTAARNTLDLLDLAGRSDVPVAVGAGDPIAGPYRGGVPHIHGRNGIGNVILPASSAEPIAGAASEMISRLAREHEGQLRIVTIGPLTNLALALRDDPELAGLVHSVTVMGGAALEPGNTSAVAEANFANDPEAARVVVETAWPVTLVPLDVTMQNMFEEADLVALAESETPFLVAISQMLDLYYDFYTTVVGRRSSALHDPLATAIADGSIAPVVAPWVTATVDDTQGPGRGQLIADLRGKYRGFPDEADTHVRVVLSTDRPLAPILRERLLTLR